MRLALLLAAAGLILSGCQKHNFKLSPVSLSKFPLSEADERPLPGFQVSWWTPPLVKSPLLEYNPLESATPAVDPETKRVIISSRDGIVRCLEDVRGKVLWTFTTSGIPHAGALAYEGTTYIPGGDGVLYALDTLTGEKRWAYAANEELVTTPVVSGPRVYVASQAETLFAVDKEKGTWIWQHRREPLGGYSIRGLTTPIVEEGVVYMGFGDGEVVALKEEDGRVLWERKLSSDSNKQFIDVDAIALDKASGSLFAASYTDGVFALDAKTGDTRWQTKRLGINGLAVGSQAVFASGDGWLTALHLRTGRELWRTDLTNHEGKDVQPSAAGAPICAYGYVFVPTGEGLAIVDERSGRVATLWDPGRGISATPRIFTAPDRAPEVYVLTNLSSLFALRSRGS